MGEATNKDLTSDTAATSGPDPVLFQWTSHPAKARPRTAAMVAIFLLILVVVVYLLTYSALFTVAAALILWGSLSQFFVRTTFEFTDNKVKVKYVVNKIEKEWTQYRSYYVDKHGVLLSPFIRPSRLENFRGLYIRFDANKEAVMNVVKMKIRKLEDPV